jgi:polyisoprenoid-binding protein YceI
MRSTAIAAAALLAVCAAAPALAQVVGAVPPSEAVSRDASTLSAGEYKLDSRHVSVLWRTRHLGMSLFTARFDKVSGTLNFDSANPAGSSVSVTIDANSVNTGVLNQAGERAFDREIAHQVFCAEANPNITFASTSIAVTGPDTGVISGNLTLNGVTKPIAIEARFWGGRMHPFTGKAALGFAGRALIKRSDFNASLSGPANGAVSDDVEIIIEVEFLKA